MLLDHTNQIGPFGQPASFLRSQGMRVNGLAGLGDLPADAATSANLSTSDIQNIVTALNSEALYLLNLQRISNGLQPISAANAAPAVNIGVSSQTQTFVMLGIAALIIGAIAHKRA